MDERKKNIPNRNATRRTHLLAVDSKLNHLVGNWILNIEHRSDREKNVPITVQCSNISENDKVFHRKGLDIYTVCT